MEKISVAIPVFNAEKTLSKALESVKNQTAGDFEIIIVDDGSTDKSAEVAENFITENPFLKIYLFRQKNLGVSAARNSAIANATGNFIALLDADDEWHPEKTERQMKIFRKNQQVDLLGTRRNGLKILWPYHVSGNNLAEINFNKLLIRNDLQPSTVIFKRRIWDEGIKFNEGQTHAEDVGFFLAATEKFQLFILDENLVTAGGGKRTFGISGLSADLGKMHQGFMKNILRLHQEGRIGTLRLNFLTVFYKMKYILLVLRTKCRG